MLQCSYQKRKEVSNEHSRHSEAHQKATGRSATKPTSVRKACRETAFYNC